MQHIITYTSISAELFLVVLMMIALLN